MNKLFLVIFSTLLLTSMALADHPADAKHKGKHKDRFISKLQLTDDQRRPVADILKEQKEKGREIMQSVYEQVIPQMDALHEETRQRLAGILTEEQLQKYEELSSKRHERMQRRFSHR